MNRALSFFLAIGTAALANSELSCTNASRCVSICQAASSSVSASPSACAGLSCNSQYGRRSCAGGSLIQDNGRCIDLLSSAPVGSCNATHRLSLTVATFSAPEVGVNLAPTPAFLSVLQLSVAAGLQTEPANVPLSAVVLQSGTDHAVHSSSNNQTGLIEFDWVFSVCTDKGTAIDPEVDESAFERSFIRTATSFAVFFEASSNITLLHGGVPNHAWSHSTAGWNNDSRVDLIAAEQLPNTSPVEQVGSSNPFSCINRPSLAVVQNPNIVHWDDHWDVDGYLDLVI